MLDVRAAAPPSGHKHTDVEPTKTILGQQFVKLMQIRIPSLAFQTHPCICFT